MIDEIYFETIKCDDGNIYNLSYHQKRIARTVGLNINLSEFVYAINYDLLKCKVLYNHEGIIDIHYSKYIPKHIDSFRIIEDNNITYKYKSTNRKMIDNLYKQKDGSSEIIIVQNGLITDTSIANIAILKDNIWQTPKQPLLHGTTKDRLLDEKLIIANDLTIDDLKSAKKIAIMNAMVGFKVIENFSLK
jgi:4-amino-4-deoxychorismate lyase